MALKEVAPLLAKDFVMLMIDEDRMTGGKDVFAKYCAKPGGIPWFAFLDADNHIVATSDAPKIGNIGFPTEEVDYAHLRGMIEKVAKRLTPADIDVLIKAVRAAKPAT